MTGLVTHDNGYPSLSCKAYNGRVFLLFLLVCLESLCTSVRDRELDLAISTCKALAVFFDRVERAGRYLSEEEARGQCESCWGFIKGYYKLADLNVQRNVSRFKLLPKLHIMCHLAEDIWMYRYNIKYHHTYKDEDNVGLLKKLAVAVAKPIMEYRILLRWQLRLVCWQPGTGV